MKKTISCLALFLLVVSCTKTREEITTGNKSLAATEDLIPVSLYRFQTNPFGTYFDYSYIVENDTIYSSFKTDSLFSVENVGKFALAKVDRQNSEEHMLILNELYNSKEEANKAAALKNTK